MKLKPILLTLLTLCILAAVCVPAAAAEASSISVSTYYDFMYDAQFNNEHIIDAYVYDANYNQLSDETVVWELQSGSDVIELFENPAGPTSTTGIRLIGEGCAEILVYVESNPSINQIVQIYSSKPVLSKIGLSATEVLTLVGDQCIPSVGYAGASAVDQWDIVMYDAELSWEITSGSDVIQFGNYATGYTPYGYATYELLPLKEGVATICVTAASNSDYTEEVTVYVSSAADSITLTSDQNSYYTDWNTDEPITLSGIGTPGTTLYFFISGAHTPVTSFAGSSAVVDADGNWSCTISSYDLESGSYVIYATTSDSVSDAASLVGGEYAATTVLFYASAIDITSESMNPSGALTITGTAPVSNTVRYYVFGNDAFEQGEVSVIDDHFVIEFGDGTFARSGSYTVFVHDAMYDGLFSIVIGEDSPYPVTYTSPGSSVEEFSFNVLDSSSDQASWELQSLFWNKQSNCDDTFDTYSVVIGGSGGSSGVTPIVEDPVLGQFILGSPVQVSGIYGYDTGSVITVEILSMAYVNSSASPGTDAYRSTTTTVEADGSFSASIDTTGLVSGEYQLRIVAPVASIERTISIIAPPSSGSSGSSTCDHSTWIAWGDDEFEKTTIPDLAGNYYLVSDITRSSNASIYPDTETVMNICLNGHVVTGDISINENVVLNLYDCNPVEHRFSFGEDGRWMLDQNGNHILLGGVITGGNMTISGTGTMYGGNIIGNSVENGGGVSVTGTFTMNQGQIAGNTAENNGGGVFVYNGGIFVMNGGAIVENGAENGGGVAVRDETSTFEMHGGMIINNTAKNGGGIDVRDNASFFIRGGEILENAAIYGGGAFVRMGSRIIMEGGFIDNNTAINGAGMRVKDSVFSVSGNPKITGNNELNVTGSFTVTGDFSGKFRNITGDESFIVPGSTLVVVESSTLKASDILGNVTLSNKYPNLMLEADDVDNVIRIVATGNSSDGTPIVNTDNFRLRILAVDGDTLTSIDGQTVTTTDKLVILADSRERMDSAWNSTTGYFDYTTVQLIITKPDGTTTSSLAGAEYLASPLYDNTTMINADYNVLDVASLSPGTYEVYAIYSSSDLTDSNHQTNTVTFTVVESAENLLNGIAGGGTEESPYLITSAENLAQVSTAVFDGLKTEGLYFKLVDSIDLSSYSSWDPIGGRSSIVVTDTDTWNYAYEENTWYNKVRVDSTSVFSGVFDGNGNRISGLTINEPEEASETEGLFGRIKNAEIKNLTLTAVNITSRLGGGAIVGSAINSIIEDCSVSGTFSYGGMSGGGVAGFAEYDSLITRCSADVTIHSSGSNVGGLVGYLNMSTIEDCYAVGTISETSENIYSPSCGGLVSSSMGGTITQSYAVVTIDSSSISDLGGLVSFMSSGTISKCYSAGDVQDTQVINPDFAGGIVGFVFEYEGSPSPAVLTNNYRLSTALVNGQTTSGETTDKNGEPVDYNSFTADQNLAFFNDTLQWDFDTVWKMGANGLPILKTESEQLYSIGFSIEGNGHVLAESNPAAAGSVVTLTPVPDTGYVFKEWQSLVGNVTFVNNSFVMPAHDVIVKAIFEQEQSIPTLPNTLSLKSGWNFVSVPKYLNSSLDTAFELFGGLNTNGNSLLGYDAQTGWYTLRADTAIEPLSAYWVYTVEPVTIDLGYSEKINTPATKPLSTGWNAVGLSAETSMSASDVFAGLDWVRYLPWDLNSQGWGTPVIKGGSTDGAMITLGNGGWLYVNAEGKYLGNTA